MAKESDLYVDCSHRRGVESLIWLDDGKLLGCSFTPGTVLRRLERAISVDTDTSEKENDPDE